MSKLFNPSIGATLSAITRKRFSDVEFANAVESAQQGHPMHLEHEAKRAREGEAELLEALKAALERFEWLQSEGKDKPAATIKRLRAAIAKAEGK